jgi:TorA maturation chaperone TorD
VSAGGRGIRTDRWELIRALAAACDTPSAGSTARQALGLGPMPAEDHTRVFVMNLPPHASIYLGPEGQLGGEAADRVAGFWRAIGIAPDADPDHLASLLALYAHLGAAGDEPGLRPSTAQAVIGRRDALLWEHLWPWVPAYTSAVGSLGLDAFTSWAQLLRRTLASDVPGAARLLGEHSPLALRDAPPPIRTPDSPAALLDAMVAPIRCGFILTRQRLVAAAAAIGVGYRLGERRFALKAMLEQDVTATLAWVAEEADLWAGFHSEATDTTSRWWAGRAASTARTLRELVHDADDGAREEHTSADVTTRAV